MSLLVDNISIGGSYSTWMHTTTIDISKKVWRSQMYWFRLFRKKRGCTRRISQVVKTKMFIRLQAYCIESLRFVQPQPRLWFTKNAPGFLSSVTFHLRSFTVSLLLYRCSSWGWSFKRICNKQVPHLISESIYRSSPHHAFVCGLLNLFTREPRIAPHKKNDVVDGFTSIQNILLCWSNPFTMRWAIEAVREYDWGSLDEIAIVIMHLHLLSFARYAYGSNMLNRFHGTSSVARGRNHFIVGTVRPFPALFWAAGCAFTCYSFDLSHIPKLFHEKWPHDLSISQLSWLIFSRQ